ncbi:MAG: hypothetical protein V1758_03030 [Pseudomonadota bacterium]
MERTDSFSFSFYFHALKQILGSPGRFFSELPQGMRLSQPFGFLLVSSLFFTGASLTTLHGRPWLTAGTLLLNALAMPLVNAGVGFMIIILTLGRRVAIERLFAVYAFSSGAVLLVSWIPLFVYVTEPWKWALVGIGMVKGCGFRWTQTVMVIGLSVLIVVLFFWSLGPVIYRLKGASA